MFGTRVVAGIVAFLALLVACSDPVQPDPTPDTAATVEALVATRVAEAIPLAPLRSAEDYFDRGVASFDLGQYERAIQDFDEAIRLNPEFATAYYNRGLAYADLGQYERAIQDWDEAIRFNPEYAAAYNNRGVAYEIIGKQIEAERDFAKAKELGVEGP